MILKILLLVILLFSAALNIKSQDSFVDSINSNTIKFWFNINGDIVPEKYADFYRIGSIDQSTLYFDGEFTDYFKSGEKLMTGFFTEAKLSGNALFYYKSGELKESGTYYNGVRSGLWSFYYSNGQIEKTVIFKDGIPFIKDCYDKNGEQTVKDGTGSYKGVFSKNNGKKQEYSVSGNLKEGKLTGKWTIPGITKEYFNEGVFEYGFDVLKYTSPQQISLDNILGYCVSENLIPIQNNFFCTSCIEFLMGSNYFNVNGNINSTPYGEFNIKLSHLADSLNIKNGGYILEFDISERGTISNIEVFGLFKNSIKYFLSSGLNSIIWDVASCDEKFSGRQYIMFLIINGRIVISEPRIVTNNTEANFMINQMKERNLIICN